MTLQRVIPKKIGELLVESGKITRKNLEEALEKQKKDKRPLGEILVSMSAVTEEEIAYCLSIQYGIPFLQLQFYELDEKVMALFPKEMIEEGMFVPLDQMGKILTVAIANPLDEETLAKIEKQTGMKVQYFVCTMSEINQTIAKYLKK